MARAQWSIASGNLPTCRAFRRCWLTILLTYSRSAISGWKISTQFTLNCREKVVGGVSSLSESQVSGGRSPGSGAVRGKWNFLEGLCVCLRVVSHMQAVSSPVPGESMSSSSPDVPPHRHSYEVSQHNSQLNMPQSYEGNQHNHQMNVPISHEYHQQMFRITIGNWTFKYLQIPWSLLRHTKRDQMLGMMPSSMHAMFNLKPKNLQRMFRPKTMFLLNRRLWTSERGSPWGHWPIAKSGCFVSGFQADANHQISQAHGEAREASEVTIRVRTEALEVIRQAQEEAMQVVLTQHQEVQKRDHMLREMQSQMQKLMMKIRQQDELIQE